MGDISEMMLGVGANDLFLKDTFHRIKNEPLEDDPDDPVHMPTYDDTFAKLYSIHWIED